MQHLFHKLATFDTLSGGIRKTRSLLFEVFHKVVDEEVDGLVDIPLHIRLGENAFRGPAVLHVLKQDNLQLVTQNLC